MGRSPCCSKEGLKRGAWTALEDQILSDYIKLHGEGGWRNLPNKAGLKRCGKSCRLRWLNYLRPDIKRGNISPDEDELILRLHNLLGNRWSLIAGRLPGRTDNEIKNYWNTTLSKRVHHQDQKARSRSSPSSDGGHGKPEPKPKKAPTSHNVVRTKASKCTKVFITTQLPNKGLFQLDDNGLSTSKSPSMPENSLSSSSSDYFPMDFGVMNSELCLTNLLGDDDHCLIFSKEMQHYNWSGSDHHVGGGGEDDLDQLQPNTVMNFQPLTCCLDGDADQQDWLQLDQ